MSDKIKVSADLRGVAQLVTEATVGITNLVEAQHTQIVNPSFLPSTFVQRLITRVSRFTFRGVRAGTRLVGEGIDQLLERLTATLGETKTNAQREAARSALNGVLGDYLAQKGNPLQITAHFRYRGKALPTDAEAMRRACPEASGKVLLLVHGLCMNDAQWTRENHNHGTALAAALGATPVYLRYNSGLHVSTNGQRLAVLLEALVSHWPVPVETLTVVAHSMGGLVARSALHYGQQRGQMWPQRLRQMVFLGTPHHGAPAERVGNYVDVTLEAIAYAKAFARLGKVRSAGITDLRHGSITDEDWRGRDRFAMRPDPPRAVPLPETVACYSVAAALKTSEALPARTLGDGLVSLESALGQHANPARRLRFKAENTWVAHGRSHFDLLSDSAVYARLEAWLKASDR